MSEKLRLQNLIHQKFAEVSAQLDERGRRLWAASEAKVLGRGGVSCVARATGLSRSTIHVGLRELAGQTPPRAAGRTRRPGAGRPRLSRQQPLLIPTLSDLVDPTTRGDPQSSLRWVCKSVRHLATALHQQGFTISHQSVARLLDRLGYHLQTNRKTREGKQHPDRDAQFQFIASEVAAFQDQGQPVVSVDTKKKEPVGDFRNAGREWQPGGQPQEVRVYDFVDKELGKAIPYGVYDVTANVAWVSVGVDHDTAEFAAETVWRWWRHLGRQRYPRASDLLIAADGGGSNSSRGRLWKVMLQLLADRTGLRISVCHFPPGTSKWNKIEHRVFGQISRNWRARPLESLEVIVQTIRKTTTETGLRIEAELDRGRYPIGITVSNEELGQVCLWQADFHGEWNYTIWPTELWRSTVRVIL